MPNIVHRIGMEDGAAVQTLRMERGSRIHASLQYAVGLLPDRLEAIDRDRPRPAVWSAIRTYQSLVSLGFAADSF
jgi:hypothetical protein